MRHILTAKNAVKYLINTSSYLQGNLYDGILNGKLLVKELSEYSRNVVILVYPNKDHKNLYFVIKQVQKNDKAKIKSLRNEAIILKSYAIVFGLNYLDFDIENNILVYENFFKLEILTNRAFETPQIGITIANALFGFSRILPLDELNKISFQILDNRSEFINSLQLSNDLSIKECLNYINNNLIVFERIKNRWDIESNHGVLHGDVKFSNLVIIGSEKEINFIDFESVGKGNRINDISNFIFNYYRYIRDWGNNGLDATLSSSQIKKGIVDLIKEYSKLADLNEEEVLNDSLSFFFVKLIENYIAGSTKGVWSETEKNLEYRRVRLFQDIIVNYPNIDFNYLK